MSIISRFAVLSVAGILLAACGGGAVKVQPTYVNSYDPGMLQYAVSKGAILTEVVGNLFDVPKEEVDAAVTRSMTGATFGRMARFTTKVSPDYNSPYRVVVLLDPALGAQANRLCSDPGQPTATLINTATHLLTVAPFLIGALLLFNSFYQRQAGERPTPVKMLRLGLTLGIIIEFFIGIYNYLAINQVG